MAIRLPTPPAEYSAQWMNQYTRLLETENQRLNSVIQQLLLFIAPSYTTAERTALDDREGQVVWDTDIAKLFVNTGSGWEQITSV